MSNRAQEDGLYKHKELPQQNGDQVPIRLLLLHPAPRDNPIVGQIVERQIDQKYEALSYCWGAKDELNEPIYLSVMDNTQYLKLEIRPNLASALRQLRNESGSFRPLWIDAICIDQANDAEKSQQIPMMDNIFQKAEQVCIWLGEETTGDADNLAVQHIKEIIKLEGFENLIQEEYTDRWAALASLMKREWFSRRWVVQEIAYAQQAVVYWGSQKLDWKEMADAVALFGSRAPEIAELFRRDSKYGNRSDFLGDVEALSAYRLVQTIGKIFRKADNGQRVERLLSLEALISNLSAFNASRPHDVIYSILSLAKGTRTTSKRPEKPRSGRKRGLSNPSTPRTRSPPKQYFNDSSALDAQNLMDLARPLSVHGSFSGNIPALDFYDQMPEDASSCLSRLLDMGYEQNAISKALERVRKHTDAVTDPFDYDRMINNLPDKDMLPIQPTFWDHESLSWMKKGIRGLYAMTQKLLLKEAGLALMLKTLFSTVQDKTFHVDYQKPFYEVCKDFVSFTIKSSKSLDMLCRPWAPDEDDLPDYASDIKNLPSWICPLSRSPFLSRPDGNFGRLNADLLVGMPDTGSSTYTATKETIPDGAFFGGKGERTLFVTGLMVDKIRFTATEAVEGNIPSTWLTLGNWHNTRTESPPESFWRTIVADRNETGQNPPSYYQRACQYAFAQRVNRGSLNTERLIQRKISQVMTDYLKRVQAVVWMRKLIRTEHSDPDLDQHHPPKLHVDGAEMDDADHGDIDVLPDSSPSSTPIRFQGRLGLVPQAARKGDMICTLKGCSVPVVLRKLDPPTVYSDLSTLENLKKLEGQLQAGRWAYARCKLIGECYIHGIMDGEVFRLRDSKTRPLEDTIFEIE